MTRGVADERGLVGHLLEARSLHLGYGQVEAVAGVDVHVDAGESVAVVGPSGSGKSSLLYALAGVLRPSAGQIWFDGCELSAASEATRSLIRRQDFGFVFQFAELVPELSLLDNVALPLRLNGESVRSARSTASDLLDDLGIGDQAKRRPSQVSGGQCQRAAVARAVVHQPRVVFADEPTGALDSNHAGQVLHLLMSVAERVGSALVIVTHDAAIAAAAGRCLQIVDGRLAPGASPTAGT